MQALKVRKSQSVPGLDLNLPSPGLPLSLVILSVYSSYSLICGQKIKWYHARMCAAFQAITFWLPKFNVCRYTLLLKWRSNSPQQANLAPRTDWSKFHVKISFQSQCYFCAFDVKQVYIPYVSTPPPLVFKQHFKSRNAQPLYLLVTYYFDWLYYSNKFLSVPSSYACLCNIGYMWILLTPASFIWGQNDILSYDFFVELPKINKLNKRVTFVILSWLLEMPTLSI